MSTGRRLFFDVSGLLQWFAYETRPTGIQRVESHVLRAAIESGREIVLIARCPGSTDFFSVPPQLVTALVGPDRLDAARGLRQLFIDGMRFVHPLLFLRQARKGHAVLAVLGKTMPGARSRVPPAPRPAAGDTIVGLGDFWCHRGHAEALVRLKQESGAALVHMVHDLFALGHADWTHPHYGPQLVAQLEHLAPHVDRWLVNSRFVKTQLGAYIAERRLGAPGIAVVPMGWDSFPDVAMLQDDRRAMKKLGLTRGEYILHVGTVEPRKNLGALVDAMCRLRAELGDRAPACVWVGREGWRSGEVRRQLRRTSFGGGTIRWIQEVDDADLPSVYRCAAFAVMPSLGEGWGLPVQESLAHGLPCISSNAGGLPEAGVDLARYVDPSSGGELFRAMRHWATDAAAVGSARAAIHSRFARWPSRPIWRDAAETVLHACELPAARPQRVSDEPALGPAI